MSKRPIILEDDAHFCRQRLLDIASGKHDAVDPRTVTIWRTACSSLLNMFQTQERYSESRIERMMTMNPSHNVQRLAKLTPESLDELRAKMTADFPGKKSKPA